MPRATRKSLSVSSPARSSPRASTKASTAAAGTTSPAKSQGRRGKANEETETRGRSSSRDAGKIQTPSPSAGRGGSRTRGKGDTPTATDIKTPPSAGRSRRGKHEKEEIDSTQEVEEKVQARTPTSGRRGRGSIKDGEPNQEAEAKKTLAAASRRSRSRAGKAEELEGDSKTNMEADRVEVKSSPAAGRRSRGRAGKEEEAQEKAKEQATVEVKTPPASGRRGRGSSAKKGEDHKAEEVEVTPETDARRISATSGRRGRNQGRSEAEQKKEETSQEVMEKEVNKTPVSGRRGRGKLGKEEEKAEGKEDQADEISPSPSKRGRGKNKNVEEADEKGKEVKSPTSARHGVKVREEKEEPEEKETEEAVEAEEKMEVAEEKKDDKQESTPKKGRGRGGPITVGAAETKSTPPRGARSSRRSAGPVDAEGGHAEESTSPPVRSRNKGKSDKAKPGVVDSESAGNSDGAADAEKKEPEAEQETTGDQKDDKLTKQEIEGKSEGEEQAMAEKETATGEEEGTKPPSEKEEMETVTDQEAKDVNTIKTDESPDHKTETSDNVKILEDKPCMEPAQEEVTPMEQELPNKEEPRNGEAEMPDTRNKISGKRKLEEEPLQDESVSAAAKKTRLNGTELSSVDTVEPDSAPTVEEMNDAEVLKSFVVVNKEELPAPDSEEVAAAVPQSVEEIHSSSSEEEETMETEKIVLPCFVEPAVVPLTEAEMAKAYASEIQGSKKEESDDISSVIVEVGSVAGSDITSGLAARGLDISELQSASNSIDGDEVADASINESGYTGPDSEFISPEVPQEVAATDSELPLSEKSSSTSLQSGSTVLVSKGSSSVSLSLGTPDPTFLATYSSPDIFTRAYVPNPAVSPESDVVANSFSVVSYNILAECHRLNSDYSYTPAEYLGLEYRHALLMKELTYLNGDIVCLQEVSPAYFSSTLLPAMKSLGYEGLMLCRTKGVGEGEATFYKPDRFVLDASKEVSLGEAAQKEVDAGGLTPEVSGAVKKYLDRADVVLITKLRCKNSGKVITVGNVHIVWDNLMSPDVQCIQAACAIKEIVTVAGGDGAHVICGDFNSQWSSPVYQLVLDGYLSDSSIQILQDVQRLELEDGAKSLVNHLWGAFQHTSSNLKSAYSAVTKSEPEVTTFTSSMKKAVDYIFYSAGSLVPVGVLKTIDRAIIDASDGLPNKHIPSDHLSLKSVMAFTK